MKSSKLLRPAHQAIIRVLELRGASTVAEVASELGQTLNGVRVHLNTMVEIGIVKRLPPRKGVRKPHQLFGLAAPSADAYKTFFSALAEPLSLSLSAIELEELFEKTGKAASQLGEGGFRDRLSKAAEILTEMGAELASTEDDAGVMITGRECPLRSVVEKCPAACSTIVSLVSETVGAKVEKRCTYEPHPRCGLYVHRVED